MMNKILSQFKKSVKKIADATEGRFEGEKILTVRRRVTAIEGSVRYRDFRISFLYHVGRGSGPKSVLSLLLYKDGDPLSVPYLMYDAMNIIDNTSFDCYTYSFLPDSTALAEAFEYLEGKLAYYFPKLCGLFADDEKYKYLRTQKVDDIIGFFGRDVFAQAESMDSDSRERYLSRVYDVFFSTVTTRFASGGYSLFLSGDKDGALRRYNMFRYLTEYERRLVSYLRSDVPLEASDAPNYLTDGLTVQAGKGAALPTVISWLILTAALSPVFYGLYMLLVFLLSNGAVYASASELKNAVDVAIPAAITALGISHRFRGTILALFSRGGRALYKRYANIIVNGGIGGITRYFLPVCASVAVIFTMLLSNHGIRFYNDRILVNPEISSLRPIEYVYSEVEKVYSYSGYYETYGDFVESPGTLIAFSNGKSYELSAITDNKTLEKKVYPLLEKNGIKVERIKALEDLEKETPPPDIATAKT